MHKSWAAVQDDQRWLRPLLEIAEDFVVRLKAFALEVEGDKAFFYWCVCVGHYLCSGLPKGVVASYYGDAWNQQFATCTWIYLTHLE